MNEELSAYLEETKPFAEKIKKMSMLEVRELFLSQPGPPSRVVLQKDPINFTIPEMINDGNPTSISVDVRLYQTPNETSAPQPILIFFHGGGWVLGSIDSNDDFCRKIVSNSSCSVLSVEYRLAPEHKFPAAIIDGQTVIDWILAQVGTDQIKSGQFDVNRILLSGGSAGGNLAAALSNIYAYYAFYSNQTDLVEWIP